MPECNCKYNPRTDLKKVSPTGALDLKSAYANNAIPANLQSSEAKFNGIEEPSAISGRVTDAIDAAMLEKQLRGYKPPKEDDNDK